MCVLGRVQHAYNGTGMFVRSVAIYGQDRISLELVKKSLVFASCCTVISRCGGLYSCCGKKARACESVSAKIDVRPTILDTPLFVWCPKIVPCGTMIGRPQPQE